MKQLSIVILLLVMASVVSAQSTESTPSKKKVRLAFVASPQISWMNSNDKFVSSEGSKFGFDFGISTDIYWGEEERYGLATGLTILTAGGDVKYSTEASTFKFNGKNLATGTVISYSLNYLEIPFALKLRTSQFHRLTYWGQFGLTNYINIGAKADSSEGTFKNDRIPDEVNVFNAGLNVGGGVEYDFGGGNAFRAALIYNSGFMDVTSDSNDDKITMSSLKLQVGIIF